MTLPDFLVIGAMRSGTTWLDWILRSHSEIYMPKRKKEIHFFDANFQRGFTWYEGFFPPVEEAGRYHRIGEVTPRYLYVPEAAPRIRESLPSCRFLAILRNPVDRAYSHYGFSVRESNETRSFEEYLAAYPGVFSRGLYGRQVKRYLEYFQRDAFLFLVFERALAKPARTMETVASFLSVDSSAFLGDLDASTRKNPSFKPRFGGLYALCRSWGRSLRRMDYDWTVNLVKRSGVKRFFETQNGLPPMKSRTRTELTRLYEEDINTLEGLIGEDLSLWLHPYPEGDARG